MENPIIDQTTTDGNAGFGSRQRNRLLILIVVLLLIDLVLTELTDTGEARHLTGELATASEIKNANRLSLLAGIPMISLFLALIVAVMPYKNLVYSRKYFRAFLITLLTMYGLYFLLELRKVFTY
jgi:hypothetical protein